MAAKRPRILLAFDDRTTTERLAAALARTPHEVRAVGVGEAMRLVGAGASFDLLVVGIEPPELVGLELARAYRRQAGRDRPILAFSGTFKREHIEGMLENLAVRRLLSLDVETEEFLFWVNQALFPEELRSRKAPRIPASFVLAISGRQEEGRGRVLNLSEDGLFLEASAPLAGRGERVEVSFELPGQDAPIRAACDVVWSNERASDLGGEMPIGMGLSFVDLDEGTRRAIKAYVLASLLESTI